MFLRRDRIPQGGLSNLDYRAKDIPNDMTKTTSHLDTLSLPRKKNFIELLQKKIVKTAPAPIDETKKFYEETGKKLHEHTEISHKRTGQLEEKEKRKRVFTGDSNVIFNEKIYQKANNLASFEQIKRLLPGLAKEKHELHAKAIQETQLVGMEAYNKETLEGKVNLEKIREIRRAIRRRYANRKNFKKIFTAWDEDSQGQLSIKNVYNMVRRLGLNINLYEAQVLVASADRNGNEHLTLDEFLDLIFNDNSMLNVDLKKIPLKENEEFKMEKSDEVLKVLSQDANDSRKQKHQNQIHLILQNQINPISNYCIELDDKKIGVLTREKYKKLIEKTKISENLLSQQDRDQLFERFKDENNNFDYKNFITEIKNFNFNPDEAYNESLKEIRPDKASLKQQFYEYENKVLKEPKEFQILDIKALSLNHLENIRIRFKKVQRALNNYFAETHDLDDFLKKQLNLDAEEFEQVNLSQKNLVQIFGGLFSNIDDKRITKKDLESFLSVLNYNEYGYTKAKTISDIIYKEDDNDFYIRVSNKLKGPEPPEIKTKFGNFVNEEDQQPNNTKNNKNLVRSQSALPYSKKPINQILEKIDTQFFVGRMRAYDAFKFFDKDKDGFISKEDLFKRFQELNILNRNEFETFMEYIDPNNKGFLNFSDFSQKVKPNMGKTDNMGNFLNPPNVLPSKTMNENFLKNIENVKTKINQIYLPYRPESHMLTRNTRIGNTPAWKNTFVNFQAPNSSAMHITEQERFHLDKVKYLKDEQTKQSGYENARLEKIKNYHQQISEKINNQAQKNEEQEKFKLQKKGEVQWAYEHRCRLRNEII